MTNSSFSPPNLRSWSSALPAPLTSFVGRVREIDAIRASLAKTRLLTLTGAGGSGKTRLALEVVARELDESPVPCSWVELAAVRDAAFILEAVQAALGLREEADAPSPERIARVMGMRPYLLVLDNAEHLVEACANLATQLLQLAPELRIVVTSREALGVAGEMAWLVPPLSLPMSLPDRRPALEDSEAVQLFVQRAQAVIPGFVITPDNAEAVAQICHRLDGLPLALELAAVRLRALSAKQIVERLDRRFRLLNTGNRGALPRHQTLRAAIDWSYELLDTREKLLMTRLAVFGGSFTLGAVESICSGDSLELDEIVDVLSSLVEKSLVTVIESDRDARYRLLETIREYALSQLSDRQSDALVRRHAEFYTVLVANAEPELRTRQRPLWLPLLQAEIENIRQALAWSRARDGMLHVRLVGLLHWFWFATGQWPEARQWLRGALELTESAGADESAPVRFSRTRERAMVLFSAGALAALQAQCDASIPQLEEAESIASELGDERLLADVRNYLAMSFNVLRDPRAESVLLRARPWMRESGDLYALRLNYLLEGASRFVQNDIAAAIQASEEGVRAARAFELDRELAIALQQLAMMVLRSGDDERAAVLLGESLQALRRDPQLLFTCRALEYIAASTIPVRPLEAATLYGAGDEIRRTIGARMWAIDESLHQPRIDAAATKIGAELFNEARVAGRQLTVDAATTLALDLVAQMNSVRQPEPTRDTAEFELMQIASDTKVVAQPQAPSVRVRALGALEISRDEVDPAARRFGHAKARELLVYLLLHPEGRTREQVGAALWPESTAAQVRNNFHVTLHHLRRALGCAEWVQHERERYRLSAAADIAFDARDFEAQAVAALRAARSAHDADAFTKLSEAAAAYQGAFLDGESVSDWALEFGDRLARLNADILETLGADLMQQSRYEEATVVFDKLVAQERMSEAAYRCLMTARWSAGDATGALREFRRLESVLRREELGDVSAETAALARRIARGEAPPRS